MWHEIVQIVQPFVIIIVVLALMGVVAKVFDWATKL
jgi:hypothetical protein